MSGSAQRGGLLIVDEAFADFDGESESLAPVLPAGAVVLRSFGKSFGLAGLRLGFAIASAELVEPLRAALGDWPVSGPAIAIGTKALADRGWADAMRDRLGKDAARLDALLKERRLSHRRWDAPIPPRREKRRARRIRAAARGGHSRAALRSRPGLAAVRDSRQ